MPSLVEDAPSAALGQCSDLRFGPGEEPSGGARDVVVALARLEVLLVDVRPRSEPIPEQVGEGGPPAPAVCRGME